MIAPPLSMDTPAIRQWGTPDWASGLPTATRLKSRRAARAEIAWPRPIPGWTATHTDIRSADISHSRKVDIFEVSSAGYTDWKVADHGSDT
jgi:hypothetical protein